VQWWPPVPLALFAYFVLRCVTAGSSLLRIAGLVITALWAMMALYDWKSGGKLLRWLYPDVHDDRMN
jgi:hypothetical protein